METLIILVVTLTCMFFMTYYLCGRDLLAPPVIMTGMFIIGSMFALLNSIEWEIDYSWKAYALIVTGIVAFDVPFVICYQIISKEQPESEEFCKLHVICISRWKVFLTIAVDLLLLIIYYQAVNTLVRNTGYMGTNVQFYFRTVTSYEGTENLNVIVRQLVKVIETTAYIFTFVFVNNVIYKSKIRKNIIYLLPALMSIIKAFMSGGRLEMLRFIAFVVIVAYILNQKKFCWKKNISIKYICVIIAAFFIVLPLFYYTLSLTGRSTTRTMFQMISTYVGGPIQHFNQYILEPTEPGKYFGTETFTPILNLLDSFGLIDYHKVVHLEYRRLGITMGNVYTFFRRPLHDFGIVGMYLFVILVSSFFSGMYLFKVKYKRISYTTDFYIMVYGYFMYWIILSSIEQYAVIYISIYTVITLLLLYVLWKFYFYVDFKKHKIIIRKSCKIFN